MIYVEMPSSYKSSFVRIALMASTIKNGAAKGHGSILHKVNLLVNLNKTSNYAINIIITIKKY